jgi:hypothetical protein
MATALIVVIFDGLEVDLGVANRTPRYCPLIWLRSRK